MIIIIQNIGAYFTKLRFTIIIVIITTANLYSQYDTISLSEVTIIESFPNIAGIKKKKVDSLNIKRFNYTDISKSLTGEAGIDVRTYGDGGISLVSIRGSSSSHTGVIWNDIPLNSPMLGQFDFSLMPSVFADNITLLAGSSSMLCHLSGIGGTIYIENKPVFKNNHSFEMLVSGGHFGFFSGGLSHNVSNKSLFSKTRLFYRQSQNNFLYKNNAVLPEEIMPNKGADYVNSSIMQELFYKKNNHNLGIIIWLHKYSRNIPPLMMNVESAEHEEIQEDNSIRIATNYEYSRNKVFYFIKPGFSYNELIYSLIHKTLGGNITAADSDSYLHSFSNHAGLRFRIKKIIVRSGIYSSLNNAKIIEKKYFTGYHKSNYINTLYSNFEYNVSNKFKSVIAIQKKFYDNSSGGFLPSIHFAYKPLADKTTRIFSSVSLNQRFPDLNDLYFIPGGNPSLKPEKSKSLELGIEDCLENKKINCIAWSLTCFYQEIDDWILWQPSQFGYWSPLNIRKSNSLGFSAESSVQQNFTKGYFAVQAQYTYNKAYATDGNYRTGQPVYLPLHKAFIRPAISFHNYRLIWDINYSSLRKTALYENTWSPDLTPLLINNANISKELIVKKTKLEMGVSLNNIFNVSYQQILWRPMPGRHMLASIKFLI